MICRAEVAVAPAGEAAAAEGQEAAPADGGAAVQPAEGAEGEQQQGGGAGAQRGGAKPQGVDLGSFKLPADAMLKQDIPLPRRMASCVIGIKGQSVSKLRRESGAKIHVRPAAGRDELDQVVEIEGTIESVSACAGVSTTLHLAVL